MARKSLLRKPIKRVSAPKQKKPARPLTERQLERRREHERAKENQRLWEENHHLIEGGGWADQTLWFEWNEWADEYIISHPEFAPIKLDFDDSAFDLKLFFDSVKHFLRWKAPEESVLEIVRPSTSIETDLGI